MAWAADASPNAWLVRKLYQHACHVILVHFLNIIIHRPVWQHARKEHMPLILERKYVNNANN